MATQLAPRTEQAVAQQTSGTRWLFTVDNYHQMLTAGIFTEDDRVELIDGEVRTMSPIGRKHSAIVKRYIARLEPQVGATAILSVQDPIVLNDNTEPQPDLALLKPREDFYEDAAPTAADVFLIIEVCDTTIEYDRNEKLPRYALAGIPEVWLTDANNKAIERYTDPQGNQYATKQTFKPGQSISVQALPHVTVQMDSIFRKD